MATLRLFLFDEHRLSNTRKGKTIQSIFDEHKKHEETTLKLSRVNIT